MLHTFVSSQVFRLGAARLGVASFSVFTHAGLITLAVVGSGRTGSLTDAQLSNAVPAERVLYAATHEPARDEGAVASAARRALAAKKAPRWTIPDLAKVRATIDASIAATPVTETILTDIDLTALTSNANDFGGVDTGALLEASALRFLKPGKDGAYSADVVERTAWPKQSNPTPRYPSAMLRAGVEATFPVQFVVDSTGRVDVKTMAFPKSVQPMFITAVKEALRHCRYFPAELAGVRVRQLVQQQFTFVIAR